MTGDEDVLVPPLNSRLLSFLIPKAKLEVVPSCGHAIPVTDPECVRRALDRIEAMGRAATSPSRSNGVSKTVAIASPH